MVNVEKLKDAIDNSGLKRTYLAAKIGKSIQAFRLKCNGTYDFTTTEVEILCHELGITRLTQKEDIFFAKQVGKLSTSKEV